MSEKPNTSFSIDTYLSKQEGLLLDHIRRLLQAETKVTLLESALQDMYKRNEEQTTQLNTTKIALDQAIAGLSAVANEKDDLVNKVNALNQILETVRSDLNDALIHKGNVEKLNEKIGVLESDYQTLKHNYDITLQEYNKLAPQPIEQPAVKKRKIKSTESEWTDGKY